MPKQLNIDNEVEKTQGLGLQNTEKTIGDKLEHMKRNLKGEGKLKK